jgi:hypothetical protein
MKKALRGAAERAEARIDDKKKARTESRHKAAGPRGVRRLGPPDESAASLAESALAALLKFAEPADVVLRRFFAAHPQMGAPTAAGWPSRCIDILRHRRHVRIWPRAGRGPAGTPDRGPRGP